LEIAMSRLTQSIILLTAVRDGDGARCASGPGSPIAKGLEAFLKGGLRKTRTARQIGSCWPESIFKPQTPAHDPSSFIKAEKTARTVLEMRADSKDATLVLASALAGQHHFADAIALVKPIVAAHPEEDTSLLILADAQLAYGDVAELPWCTVMLQPCRCARHRGTPCHLAQIRGHNAEAILHIQRGHRTARLRKLLRKEEMCWYRWRLADCTSTHGHFEDRPGKCWTNLLKSCPNHQRH